MKTVTIQDLKSNIDSLIEEVLTTGIPLEIEQKGKRLLIFPVEQKNKLDHLIYRPNIIQGNSDDLVNLSIF